MICPNCGFELADCESPHHGCMEDHGTVSFGRSLCPLCRMGCYAWKSDTSPGFKGDLRTQCCFCRSR